ncbi:MAG: hypothetical protein WCG29_07205, partial [Desulfomonile sp.]
LAPDKLQASRRVLENRSTSGSKQVLPDFAKSSRYLNEIFWSEHLFVAGRAESSIWLTAL